MYGVKLEVWGNYALFTRPEMKGERVSYDVITPSAARGILESIHWKPEMTWVINRLHVLKPVKFENIRRNEVRKKASVPQIRKTMKEGGSVAIYIEESRTQRSSIVLRNVHYIIEAHYLTSGGTETSKHKEIFERRAGKGQTFRQPVFGCREFPADFRLAETVPKSSHTGEKDLGRMLWDIDFEQNMKALFYRPVMKDGIIDVPKRKELIC